jgi:hypothetical protein
VVRLALGLLLASVLPALIAAVGVASAAPPAGEDGTLTVRAGSGTMVVRARGSIIGRLGQGTLTVTDSVDGATVTVRGADRRPRVIDARTTAYSGRGIRFRVADDRRVVVKLSGKGLNFSAVGRGNGWIDGRGDPAAGIFYDGSYSLNGGPYQSLPDLRTPFELILPRPPSSGD